MKISLIDNTESTHTETINQLISRADTLLIAVAFLKVSGLKLLVDELKKAVNRGCKVTMIVGQDFCITEPKALEDLFNIGKGNKGFNAYMLPQRKATYHPKMYLGIAREKATLVIGSANLTGGGLDSNIELSTAIEMSPDSPTVINAVKWFNNVANDKNIIKIDSLSISQYKATFKVFEKINRKAQKEIRKELSDISFLNLARISQYLKEYEADEKQQADWERKIANYRTAKRVLNNLISGKITSKKEFVALYDRLINELWHSAGLPRGRTDVEKRYKKVIELVAYVKENIALSPADLFSKSHDKIIDIKRFGVNKLTEIFNTYSPSKFSVLNQLSVNAMRNLGFSTKSDAQNFNAKDYAEFNLTLLELNKHCGFKDLAQVDHFLNYIYWKHVKPNQHKNG